MKNSTRQEKYALISVYDKKGIVDFAKTLVSLGYSLISTGGTAKTLAAGGIKIIPIEKITKNPESFAGRMKTISFQIEGGILFDRKNPQHRHEAKNLGILPIDIVVCNFYPFAEKQSIENIDVGGPTMVRAAAKNFQNVLVVVDPNDYQRVSKALQNNTDAQVRQELAGKAFRWLAYYDTGVANFLDKKLFPQRITFAGVKIKDLRYGENPHQKAALYIQDNFSFAKNLKKHWGRDLSLINITDINAGIEVVKLFKEAAACVIKHNNPCGIALGDSPFLALKRAIEGDPESAFGGVVVLNKTLDLEGARVISSFKTFQKSNIDIIAAPKIIKKASEFLKGLRKSMGIYTFGKISQSNDEKNLKWVNGGFILQTTDRNIETGFKNWRVVTKVKPSRRQIKQMQIAWKFISRIRSNAVIVIDKNLPMTRGIGSGQTSRVRSTRLALEQAGRFVKKGVLASDSFFPFDDSVTLAGKYKIGAIIQQGGSVNDQKVIDRANKLGIPMVFTLRRAFWH